MGGKAPETCWATHKRQVINLWNCCMLLVDLFESYDDARASEHHLHNIHFISTAPVLLNSIYTYFTRYKTLTFLVRGQYQVHPQTTSHKVCNIVKKACGGCNKFLILWRLRWIHILFPYNNNSFLSMKQFVCNKTRMKKIKIKKYEEK